MRTQIDLTTMTEKIYDEEGELLGERPFFKTPYNHDRQVENEKAALTCKDESRTQQNFTEAADINNIIKAALRTGVMPQQTLPQYGDLPTADDMTKSLQTVAEVRGLFYAMPADKRAEHQNDPARWLSYVNARLEAGDIEPLRDMGLDLASVDAQIAQLNAEADKAHKEAILAEAAEIASKAPPAPKT